MTCTARELVLMIAATAAALAAQAGGSAGEPQGRSGNGPKTLTEAWRAGLQRMRDQHAPGLVFVLPPAERAADAKVQERLGAWPPIKGGGPVTPPKTAREQLLWLLQRWRSNSLAADGAATKALPDLSVVFGLAVPIVAEAETCGAKADETLLLLAPDGSRKAALKLDLADGNAVADALGSILLSPEAIAARRATVPPAAQQLADKLQQLDKPGATTPDDLEEMVRDALARFHELAPVLVQVVEVPVAVFDREVRVEQWKRILATPALRRLLEASLPLGTELGETWDPCPPCGMAAVPMPMRSLLKLLPK
jgi:hypothetical protein